MTEKTAQDAAQPGRPWWRATLPTAVAGSVTALVLIVSVVASPQAGASGAPHPPSPSPAPAAVAAVTAVADRVTAPRAWQVVAHRGGVVWGPEHTRATFDHLLSAGADGVEFDVRFTRDDVAVVFHDADLARTTDCTGDLAQYTLAQVRRCDSGSWFGTAFRGSRVLTLDETLRQLGEQSQTLTYFVHMKRFSPAQASSVVAALRRFGLDDGRATVMCNTTACLQHFTAAGAVRIGYMFTTAAGWDTDWPVLMPYDMPLDAERVRAAQRRGSLVLAVEDHPAPVRELIRLGFDGVLANDLDAALGERPEFTE